MIETRPDLPTLAYERCLRADGIGCIAGVDEVGRGALAGPLTAAAVVLPPLGHIERDAAFWSAVRDSKTISMSRRIALATEIMQRADAWAVAAVDTDELDEVGVGAANRIAMERAVLGLDREPEVLLIDAMTIDSGIPQHGIIDGDALSLSIAAASIVAKVARDTRMIGYHDTWPVFGFEKHKGYGVATHLAALSLHGPCPIHRRSFAPVRRAEEMHRDQPHRPR
jgi:ribonuclease HII